MGEEGTEFRIRTLEDQNKERKLENAERVKADKITSDKIVEIEKLNIKQDITLTIIMGTLKLIAGTFVMFVVSNFGMYLISKFGK